MNTPSPLLVTLIALSLAPAWADPLPPDWSRIESRRRTRMGLSTLIVTKSGRVDLVEDQEGGALRRSYQVSPELLARVARAAHRAEHQPWPTLGRGAPASDLVARAQSALRKRGQELEVDGRLGPKTEAALRAYQRQAALPETGALDPATREALQLWTEQVFVSSAQTGALRTRSAELASYLELLREVARRQEEPRFHRLLRVKASGRGLRLSDGEGRVHEVKYLDLDGFTRPVGLVLLADAYHAQGFVFERAPARAVLTAIRVRVTVESYPGGDLEPGDVARVTGWQRVPLRRVSRGSGSRHVGGIVPVLETIDGRRGYLEHPQGVSAPPTPRRARPLPIRRGIADRLGSPERFGRGRE